MRLAPVLKGFGAGVSDEGVERRAAALPLPCPPRTRRLPAARMGPARVRAPPGGGHGEQPRDGRFSRQDESSGGIGKVLWSTELPVREWTGPDSNRRPPAYEAITEALGLVLLSQNCFSP
jgi:hypothetical protein